MWQFFEDKILFTSEGSSLFEWKPFLFDTWNFWGEIIAPDTPRKDWNGYDDWVQLFSPESEINLVKEIIQKAQKDTSYRAHIRGISLAESIKILREYYKNMWYEDPLAKNYTLPTTTQVTASISLRHTLWCEKDKRFLNHKDPQNAPYGMITPPIRGSHDLRILQQALRMNIILGIEVLPGDEKYIDVLVEQEILPPFSVSQMIQFRWEKFAF